jgi:hypothetical protein
MLRGIFYVAGLVSALGVISCAESTEFTGSVARTNEKIKNVAGKIDKVVDRFLGSMVACSLEAERTSPDSTLCNVSITGSSGLAEMTPEISPTPVGSIARQTGGFFTQVNCPATGVAIDAVFKQEVASDSGDNDGDSSEIVTVATCGVDIQPIEKPGCSLVVESQTITLGGQVKAKVVLEDDKVPVSKIKINDVVASLDQFVTFTPANSGMFSLKGSVQNQTSTEHCSFDVTVNNPPTTVAVIPPSCAINAARENALSTKCDVSVVSTGGPISGSPILSNNVVLANNAGVWSAKADCAAVGQAFTATVKNPQNTSVSCQANVPEIALPQCALTAVRKSAVSTKCLLSVSSAGAGQISGTPSIAGVPNLVQRMAVWEAEVDCAASAVPFSATVTNPRGSSTCSATVDAITKPACSLQVDAASTTLGQSVNVTLNSTGGELVSSKLNGVDVNVSNPVILTPTAAGVFSIVGTVQNPASTETCSASLTVAAPPVPPVIPASCSISASRSSNVTAQCKVVVNSTGGPLAGAPTVAGKALVQNGASWEGLIACSAAAQSIAATVQGSAGGQATCSANVESIAVWVQTNGGVCQNVCKGVGRVSIPSSQYKNRCVSGEVRGDAIGINYTQGVWGGGREFYQSNSVGSRCYGWNTKGHQKQDNDKTDITVGCYCK